jgi:hypothetical protein
MNDPPLVKGDIGGFSKLLNPLLPPFSKGGDANKYMLRVIKEENLGNRADFYFFNAEFKFKKFFLEGG